MTIQNYLLSCSSSEEEYSTIEEFIKMLEEISGINEYLMQIYLGKYFYNYLKELNEPMWVGTNSK
jgi:hypothetical protein